MEARPRGVSNVLLDFVFGEPVAQPEVIEDNTEKAWLEWQDAMADLERSIAFEDTRPMKVH